MKVPYLGLQAQHAELKAEILAAVGEVLERGDFILGEAVGRLEKELAAYCGTAHAIGLNSGTDALFLVMRAWGIGPGDEVITTSNSFLASASTIVATGARPVFVDVTDKYTMDPKLLAAAITPRTRAIMPVHLTGRIADMDPIMAIAKARGLRVVEDAAQAIGAVYRGTRAGAFGDAGCFSLHPLKTLNACGDGGFVTTNDPELDRRLRELRNIGLRNRNESDVWGCNSRLDSIQAAIVGVKLPHVDAWVAARRRHAQFYTERLGDVVGVPREQAHEHAAYHTYVIVAERREELVRFLDARGIETKIHYPIPIHRQQAAAALGYGPGSLPVTERLADRILTLPVHQYLTNEALCYVVAAIRAFYGA